MDMAGFELGKRNIAHLPPDHNIIKMVARAFLPAHQYGQTGMCAPPMIAELRIMQRLSPHRFKIIGIIKP